MKQTAERLLSRPVLRWHGGKWMLAPWIIRHFPPHRIYTEVYGGAASVLLRKPRSYSEVYNDLDGDVVNLFRMLQDRDLSNTLHGRLVLTPFAREEFELAYTKTSDPIERARRLIIRSYMGFGSDSHNKKTGFRSNSNQSGTVPAHDWKNYTTVLPQFVERLRGVVIENRPAVEVLAQHDSHETLHYVDPPYPHETRKGSNDNYAHEMTSSDHRTLAEVLRNLKGAVVLSGYACDLYDKELYQDWARVSREALADGAAVREEVLWMNKGAAGQIVKELF